MVYWRIKPFQCFDDFLVVVFVEAVIFKFHHVNQFMRNAQ